MIRVFRAVLFCLGFLLCLQEPFAEAQQVSVHQYRVLVLVKQTPAQRQGIQKLLRELQDPHSSNYHRWITPEEYGRRFGATDAQIERLRNAFSARGLTLTKVHKNRTALEISGTVEHLTGTFLTPAMGGHVHKQLARTIPPEMRDDIAAVSIGGTTAPAHPVPMSKVVYDAKQHRFYRSNEQDRAALTDGPKELASIPEGGATFYGVTPGDLAVQYSLPSYTQGSGTSINGYGSIIGVISPDNVNLAYFTNYGNTFGITMPTIHVVVDGVDPGVHEDSLATYLEVEAISAAAPNATVNIYTAGDDGPVTSVGQSSPEAQIVPGIDLALERAADDNTVNVILYPNQGCEAYLDQPYDSEGDTNQEFRELLFQEASLAGITIIVPSGDIGSAACDQEYGTTASFGLAVNGYAASPDVTAVGGTDFYYGAQGAATPATYGQYWSSSPMAYATLLKPVPEQVWNDSYQATDQNITFSYLLGSGGGIDTAGDSTTTYSQDDYTVSPPFPYPQPWWQIGIVPASISSTARVIPDIALFAGDGANNSAYVFCAEGTDCANTTGQNASNLVFTEGSGTEVSAAVFAGMMSLVVGRYGPQGNVDPTLYAMAKNTSGVFNDVVYGSNTVACAAGSPNCSDGYLVDQEGQLAYAALPGYDAATGLGTLNATALVQQWAPPSRSVTTTTFSIVDGNGKPITSFTKGTPVTLNTTVSTAGGSGPTGVVVPVNNSPIGQPVVFGDAINISNGTGSLAGATDLPGGNYTLYASFPGDEEFAPSMSAGIKLKVSPAPCSITTYYQSVQSGASVVYGTPIQILVRPEGSSSSWDASGFISVKDNGTNLTNIKLDQASSALFTSSLLAPGNHQLTFLYGGDPTFQSCSSSSSPINFTVTAAPTTTTLSSSLSAVPSTNGYYTLNAVVAPGAQTNDGAFPAGKVNFTRGDGKLIATVSLAGGTYANGAPSAQATTGPSGASLVAGNNSITASFVPASNTGYTASTSNAVSVSLGGTTGLTSSNLVLSTADGGNVYYDTMAGVTLNASVTGSGTPSGTVALYVNGQFVANMTSLGGGNWSYTFNSSTTQNYLLPLPIGNDVIMAQYSGDSTNAADWANVNLLVLDDQIHPDFSITASADYKIVTSGTTSTTITFQLQSLAGFAETVYLGASAPNGITCSFGSGGSVKLAANQYVFAPITCSNLPSAPGTYLVDITSTSGIPNSTPDITTAISHDLPLKIVVQ